MAALYRPFFLLYGGAHLLGGAAIAATPSVMTPVLQEPLSPAIGTLLGFLSALAGLGFLGAAWVKVTETKRVFVWLAVVGNVLNGLAHIANVARGDSPFYMAVTAGVSVTGFIVVLVLIDRQLKVSKEEIVAGT